MLIRPLLFQIVLQYPYYKIGTHWMIPGIQVPNFSQYYGYWPPSLLVLLSSYVMICQLYLLLVGYYMRTYHQYYQQSLERSYAILILKRHCWAIESDMFKPREYEDNDVSCFSVDWCITRPFNKWWVLYVAVWVI